MTGPKAERASARGSEVNQGQSSLSRAGESLTRYPQSLDRLTEFLNLHQSPTPSQPQLTKIGLKSTKVLRQWDATVAVHRLQPLDRLLHQSRLRLRRRAVARILAAMAATATPSLSRPRTRVRESPTRRNRTIAALVNAGTTNPRMMPTRLIAAVAG
jgi:hypothetical protein